MNPAPIRLDYHSGEAVYRQIAEQVKYQVASGRLAPGAQLPSIRALADELSINSRTVVKAYEHLASEGMVVMRQGQGVFVAQNRGGVPVHARKKSLAEKARRLLADAAGMGASLAEVVEAVERVGKEMGMNDE
jgi:DNA-binding transcriptional regulator YhcF (GntR family)